MLSYRHSFHAGNYADVLKHVVLIETLEHFIKKDKPFDYIDTHSGAGLFDLEARHANKLAEHKDGIQKLIPKEWPELTKYFEIIDSINLKGSKRFYPGSPLIAAKYLRSKDHAWLYELHPNDYELLTSNTSNNRRIRVKKEDGLKGLISHLPPVSRRGLVLIDPSYEIKSDYIDVFKAIKGAHSRFATGTYALWYPVVERTKIQQLEASLKHSGIRNIQRFELGISADTDEKGMTSTGMILINPPWNLFEKMSKLLPRLVKLLGKDDSAFFKCDILVPE